MISKTPGLTSSVTDKTGHLDIRSLLDATVKGQDPEQAAYGRTGVIDDSSAKEFTEEAEEESSPLDAFSQGSEEQESDSQDTETEDGELSEMLDSNSAPKKEESNDIEQVTLKFKDPVTGRLQKLEVDYSDREKIKKAYMQAAGMRKFQKERDLAKQTIAEVQKKYDELNDVYTKLDNAFESEGVKGVVKLLGQGENAWEEAVEKELKHREYLSNLTPTEKYRLEMEERQQAYERELTAERNKRAEFEKRISEREEQASMKSLESRLHPAFDRYRFTGKLGDPVVEHQFDEAIWNKVMNRLSEYPDSVELTQSLIDKEFREVSNNFRKMVSKQTEESVKKTIEKKKVDATKRAQVVAKKGLSTNGDKQKFVDDIKSGNIKDAFSAMFSGKVKL